MLARPLEAVLRAAPWLVGASLCCWILDLLIPSASNPDWIGGSFLWLAWLLQMVGGWLLAWIVMPLATFAAKHWFAVGAIVLGIAFVDRLVELHTVAIHAARNAARRAEENRRKRAAERARARQESRLLAMSEDQFALLIGRMRAAVSAHEERSRMLNAEALHHGGGLLGLRATALRHQADKHFLASLNLAGEIWRLQEVWLWTSAKRMASRVRSWMEQLHSQNESEARAALSELNRIWRSFDFRMFVPRNMPDADKARMVRFLQMMASTTQLGEARAAYEQFRRMHERYYGAHREAA